MTDRIQDEILQKIENCAIEFKGNLEDIIKNLEHHNTINAAILKYGLDATDPEIIRLLKQKLEEKRTALAPIQIQALTQPAKSNLRQQFHERCEGIKLELEDLFKAYLTLEIKPLGWIELYPWSMKCDEKAIIIRAPVSLSPKSLSCTGVCYQKSIGTQMGCFITYYIQEAGIFRKSIKITATSCIPPLNSWKTPYEKAQEKIFDYYFRRSATERHRFTDYYSAFNKVPEAIRYGLKRETEKRWNLLDI